MTQVILNGVSIGYITPESAVIAVENTRLTIIAWTETCLVLEG